MSFRISFSSNAAAIFRQLSELPARMAQAIAAAMDKENQITVGVIQAQELSGPRPSKIGVITNRLRGSIRAIKAVVTGNAIDSAIGSNVKYAGPLERGFSGTVTVKAHSRADHRFDVHRVETGRTRDIVENLKPWETRKAKVLSRGFKTFEFKTGRISEGVKAKKVASGVVQVRAHSMKMNIKGRHYIEGTLQRSLENYSGAISRAVVSAWESGAVTS